jgi:hypothetical protein
MRRVCLIAVVAIEVSVFAPACSATGNREPNSGISGRVVAGPTCPVETVPPQPRCAPRPLAATLRIRRAGGRSSTTIRTRADGSFSLRLVPGNYVLRPLPRAGSAYPRPPAPLRVQVHAGRFTSVTISYDTGIR